MKLSPSPHRHTKVTADELLAAERRGILPATAPAASHKSQGLPGSSSHLVEPPSKRDPGSAGPSTVPGGPWDRTEPSGHA